MSSLRLEYSCCEDVERAHSIATFVTTVSLNQAKASAKLAWPQGAPNMTGNTENLNLTASRTYRTCAQRLLSGSLPQARYVLDP
jgi:hypothetical protein